MVRERSTGRPVGTVQATIRDTGATATLAWVIGVPWQGRRYATEAARAMIGWLSQHGVTTFVATIHPEHCSSEHVARACGLHPTADTRDGERVWRSAR